MKIGFVVDDTLDKPDGVQQYVLTVGAWLVSQGHEVQYLAGASQRQDVGTVHSLSKNVRVKFNGNRLSVPLPANGRQIRELLQREQFDVLHIQMPYSPMLAHKVVRLAPEHTAIIGTFHILPQTRLVRVATHALGRWTASSLKRFNKVFAVSPAARTFAEAAFKLPNVGVLPNVVDLARFAEAQSLPALHSTTPLIMFLGRLVPRKGCSLLLNGLATLHRKHPEMPFKVVICGKGPLAATLQHQSRELGLAEHVEFAGFLDEIDKPNYLASADIAVFPSTGGESFGIVLIEAMATGQPVVLAGDNPGYRSVMYQRQELLFDPHNADQLADKLYHFLSNKQASTQAVAWQKQHVSQFDIATVGKQLEATYRQTIADLQNKVLA